MSRKLPLAGPAQLSPQEVNEIIDKRLFVGRLAPDTTEEEIRDTFSEFGELSECKIVGGGKWAFVKFDTWARAHRALIETNEKKSLSGHAAGHTITVSFAERTKKVGRGGGSSLAKGLDNSRVFVRNLPEDADEKDVEEIFKEFGEITAISMLDPKSRKRCAFVTFSLWGEALDAIESVDAKANSRDEEGLRIRVVMAEPPARNAKGEQAKLPESRLDPIAKRRQIDRSDRYQHTKSGNDSFITELERLKVAYMRAIDNDSPDSVCSELHESLLDLRSRIARGPGRRGRSFEAAAASVGKGVTLSERPRRPRRGPAGAPFSEPEEEADSSRARLSISGLPRGCYEDELEALIEQVAHGAEVKEYWIDKERGIGYVQFCSDEAAETVKDALDDRSVSGWEAPLRARWAPAWSPSAGGNLVCRTNLSLET